MSEKEIKEVLEKRSSKVFYEDVKEFHEKTRDIANLMRNFKRKYENKIKLNYKYGSVIVRENKFLDNTLELNEDNKGPLEEWTQRNSGYILRIKDKILKLELGNEKIYLFKIFDNFEGEGNYVLAGYTVEATPELRLFLAQTAEKELVKSANLLLSAL